MSHSSRDNEHVTSRYFHRLSFVPTGAKHDRGNTEGLMDHRVVMHEIINTVPPRLTPVMSSEYPLENRSRIVLSVETYGFAIEDQREFRIIRNIAVVPKFYP